MADNNDPQYEQQPDWNPQREYEAHIEQGRDNPSSGAGKCDFCEEVVEECVSIEFGNNSATLCSWPCVIAFAAIRTRETQKQFQEQHKEILSDLRKAEDDSYLADFYRAGCL